MKTITKALATTLATIGGLALLLGAGWLFFSNYLTPATAQRNPAVDIAAATNKIATDPFTTGPSLGDTLVVILAIFGALAILVTIGLGVYVVKRRQRRLQYDQQPDYRTRTRPQIASTQQGEVGDALGALVQLELVRYLRAQGSQPAVLPSTSPSERPIVQHLGPDPTDDLLRGV